MQPRYSHIFILAKFFVHGLAFGATLGLAELPWEFLLFLLALVGFRIGYVLGLVIGVSVSFFLLLMMIGVLNTLLTESVWHVNIKQGWSRVLAHGALLFTSLIIANAPGIIVNFMFPNWIVIVANSAVYCFIDGVIAKKVAFVWQVSERREEGLREAITLLKYPVLVTLLMADGIVVIPFFVLSLATKLWWLGSVLFLICQSPIVYLVIVQIIREMKWTPLQGSGWWVPPRQEELEKAYAKRWEAQNKLSTNLVLSKVFFHGLAFSALLFSIGLIWPILSVLIASLFSDLISLTGTLAVMLVLLVFLIWPVIGGLNVFLTESIWHVSIRRNYERLLAHGFALTMALAVAEGIPMSIFSLTVPQAIPLVPLSLFQLLYFSLLIAYCFINGILARRIAYVWEKSTTSLGPKD